MAYKRSEYLTCRRASMSFMKYMCQCVCVFVHSCVHWATVKAFFLWIVA